MQSLKQGSYYRVKGYHPGMPRIYRQRLLAMGLLPGSLFKIIRIAPLGDPYLLTMPQGNLVLRKAILNFLIIDAEPPGNERTYIR